MVYTRWTPARIERLTELVGRGCDIDAISGDALIAPASVQSIKNMCTRLGLPLRESTPSSSCTIVRLASAQHALLERQAARRGISADALAQRIVATTLNEQLVDAVLDDRDDANESRARREHDEIARMIAAGGDVLVAMRKIARRAG
jgi:hypothetical protein